MNGPEGVSRRGVFVKLGLLFNAALALVLTVPVARFLLSPVLRAHGPGAEAWVSLGPTLHFPEGQTRLASYRNPVARPADGDTAELPCWVRHVSGGNFQVFAINCAHLGCPVRWFPQSSLFLCPCHGGVYYADGSRASGPPERGLFEYRWKVEKAELFIEAGELPTPGGRALASLVSGHRGGVA
jgi:menaquinol-cytochrome c reductase iron-sulfur subunit